MSPEKSGPLLAPPHEGLSEKAHFIDMIHKLI